MHEENGNGAPKVTIDVVQAGPGWVVVQAGDHKPEPHLLPEFLNRALMDWLKTHPECRVRTALGIVSNGFTVGLHVWFDEEDVEDDDWGDD